MTVRDNGRLIVVSNRLPLVLHAREDGSWEARASSGGLVSALVPVLRRRGGMWLGWPGTTDASLSEIQPALTEMGRTYGCDFRAVMLTQEEMEGFYFGFSNEVIWPLFHDLFTNCNFQPAYWQVYQEVNRKFAAAVFDVAEDGDFIWVHDYHLMELAGELRRMGRDVRAGFFLHTPFPPLEIFLRLPWRFEILRSLLEFNPIGFQTLRDRRNFLQCVHVLFNIQVKGSGSVVQLQIPESHDVAGGATAGLAGRKVSVGAFPIGIDFHQTADLAARSDVQRKARELKEDIRNRQMILGVDRLDYTKGLPNKLQAFRNALHRYPELHHKVNLVQHVVPSRKEIPDYQNLRLELEHLIGQINGEFTESGWVPIHYMFHNLTAEDLVAYYLAADIAFVTSLKDGMNLVAKEYCAARVDREGVLILSEFAGAAAQLQRGALLVNPYDIDGVAAAIYRAFTMSSKEREERMRLLRRNVRSQDVFRWADSFLGVTTKRGLANVPYPEDYLPTANA